MKNYYEPKNGPKMKMEIKCCPICGSMLNKENCINLTCKKNKKYKSKKQTWIINGIKVTFKEKITYSEANLLLTKSLTDLQRTRRYISDEIITY